MKDLVSLKYDRNLKYHGNVLCFLFVVCLLFMRYADILRPVFTRTSPVHLGQDHDHVT